MKGLWGAVFIIAVVILAGICFALAYGGKSSTDASSPSIETAQAPAKTSGDSLNIAVIPKGTTHLFWKSVHAGAVKAAREFGVEITWQGPHVENERKQQIEVVQNFISRGADAIVLAPLDDVALVQPVRAAVSRGIKAVIIDSALKYDGISSFVATDNRVGGQLGGKYLANLLDGKGRIILLRYAEGSASTHEREEGFLEGIKEAGPDIEWLSVNQYGGVTAESSFQAAQNLLNRFGDKVDGVFCPNESSTFGMLRALKTTGLAGKVKFVGFDTSEPLVTGLKENEIHGLIAQDPMNMGYLGVKTAVLALRGEVIEKRIDTGAKLITPENMNDPDMHNLLEPDLKSWLNE